MTTKSINDMTEGEVKVYENRLRRMAQRQGLRLVKSRRRDPRALDYGIYWLVEPHVNGIVNGGEGQYLDGIEAFLTGAER